MRRPVGFSFELLLVLAIISADGCSDPIYQKRVAARQKAVDRQVTRLGRWEADRAKRGPAYEGAIREMESRDREMFETHRREYARAFRKDVERFEARKPEYAKEALDLLDGDIRRAHVQAMGILD